MGRDRGLSEIERLLLCAERAEELGIGAGEDHHLRPRRAPRRQGLETLDVPYLPSVILAAAGCRFPISTASAWG